MTRSAGARATHGTLCQVKSRSGSIFVLRLFIASAFPLAFKAIPLSSLAQRQLKSIISSRTASGGTREPPPVLAQVSKPLQAGFFSSAAEGESTYDSQLDLASQAVVDESILTEESESGGVQRAVWFHESESGGPRRAFQTHYPALETGPGSRSFRLGPWHKLEEGLAEGRWVQDYQKPLLLRSHLTRSKSAEWFDSSVKQYDDYGRYKAPYPGSPERLVDWQERAVNTSLRCKEAGCNASALLQAFNVDEELARNCKLKLALHPTDFDDHYSGERLTYIMVNGYTVNTDCFPMISGCGVAAQNTTFNCLQDFPVDDVVSKTGSLLIAAGISDVVDECPYEGHLLAAEPVVTCMVTPKLPITQLRDKGLRGLRSSGALPMRIPLVPTKPSFFYASAMLRCPERGCVANATLEFNETGFKLDKCLLNVKVNQTDFDGEEGTAETLEYVTVNGAVVVTNKTPGKNPCKSARLGTVLPSSEIEEYVLNNYDVTAPSRSGLLSVSAKISPYVDECAHDGYLLHGWVDVNCTIVFDQEDSSNNSSRQEAASKGNSTSSMGSSGSSKAESKQHRETLSANTSQETASNGNATSTVASSNSSNDTAVEVASGKLLFPANTSQGNMSEGNQRSSVASSNASNDAAVAGASEQIHFPANASQGTTSKGNTTSTEASPNSSNDTAVEVASGKLLFPVNASQRIAGKGNSTSAEASSNSSNTTLAEVASGKAKRRYR